MPIYEYECGTCGRVHEALQKVSDSPLTQCPDCSGVLHKRISQCTFHLKGTGWYATDYAKGAGAASSSSGKKDDSSPKEASADAQPKNSTSAGDD
ncbi:MAG: zinc ribbon domain-containing protein [Desulfobacterales bacterium]|nr:zinc ribbon domain-containing protein [Desulfobacterales bacterium]